LESELGYFSLSELESVRGPFGLPIERDVYFRTLPTVAGKSQSREEVEKMEHQNGDGKSLAQWKRELSDGIEELDKARAKARQMVYQPRPLVRPRPWTEPATSQLRAEA
jgi:hypothetical protein